MTDREILSNAIDKAIANGMPMSELVHYPAIALIYRHPFAKAYWGDGLETYCISCEEFKCICINHIQKTNTSLFISFTANGIRRESN